MDVKSTMFLLVLVVIFVQLPNSSSFQFRRTPDKPLVVYYRNRTNVEFRWEWTMASGEVIPLLKIKRYRKNFANTESVIATYYSSGIDNVDTTKYSLTVSSMVNGYASFIIKDLTNQGQGVNVMNENEIYIYKIVVDEQTRATEYDDEVELNVLRIPYITTYPRNQTASGGTVTFECAADGKPKPAIAWEKIGSSQSFSQGSPLTLTNFDKDKIGVYKCTARSTGIAESASATGFVQFATCGSGCNKEELGIEFTNLEYNPNANYEDLKNKIQTECLKAFAIKSKTIYTCQVPRFRSGSLVAVVELGWPTNYVGDPKQPLLEAINDGDFAGYPVKNAFVSPTSPPTQKPPTTLETTQSTPSGGAPSKGQRTEKGLSKGAIIALVVVFSIIFIVIIIVLIVCMLKRKKPSDTRKPYKEDGRSQDKTATTVPLKSQPFDPMYDDPNEDRYPNGGGPPPQYTPSSNYAEVRPNQQDESQVEWDKSVKDEMWI